jgi:uncharacterized protein (DUF924 family)
MTTEIVQSILQFWFGGSASARQCSNLKSSLWWSKDEDIDRDITERFAAVTDELLQGKFSEWLNTPEGVLASIICLDQFPRNMYRGNARCYSYDYMALQHANSLVTRDLDQELDPIQRVFAYLPFQHSEKLDNQARSLALYSALVASVSAEDRDLFEGNYRSAVKHHEIVREYGRFPHRNSILGRRSTPRELEFLEKPGSSF